MERRASDASGEAWFLAGAMGTVQQTQDDDTPGSDDLTPPHVIIAVSLDELDDLTGDLLV